jgi:hypothetical protein
MIKRIHVNMHIIRSNSRGGSVREPPLSIKTSRSNIKAYRVDIQGPSTVVYSPDRPLACGARVWIETNSSLLIDSPTGSTELP